MLRYIELKTGYSDNGPAWVARVVLSRSGRTIYFGSKALRRAKGGGLSAGNYLDIETGDEYWVSGVKRRGHDRHSAGSGLIGIEESAVADYLEEIGASELDRSRFRVVADLPSPDPSRFVEIENARIEA